MSEPEDMIIPMLREMRNQMSEFQDENRQQFQDVNKRLDSLEVGQKSIRHALTADTMMSR